MNQAMEAIVKKMLIAGVIGFIVMSLCVILSFVNTGTWSFLYYLAAAFIGAIYAIGLTFGWSILKLILRGLFGFAQDVSIYAMITGRGFGGFVILLLALVLFIYIGGIVGLGKLIYDIIKASRKPNYIP